MRDVIDGDGARQRAATDGSFVIETTTIPPGIRCQACGHRHLPERLHTLRPAPASLEEDGGIDLTASCPHCGTQGWLRVVANTPECTTADVLARLADAPRASGSYLNPERSVL